VPWILYISAFIVTNTVHYTFDTVEYFSINDTHKGVETIVAAVIFVCK
jgi:hypothetical protein